MDVVIPLKALRQRVTIGRRADGGFTLVELIIVIVLLGVLAVVAAPRIFNTGDFNTMGFKDQTLSLLRYAQKVAIAQRRTVCVTFTISTAQLRIASAAETASCNTDLTGPQGESPAAVIAKSGVSYASVPAAVQFNGLGQPFNSVTGAALAVASTITVAGAATAITIEPGTGYVHD